MEKELHDSGKDEEHKYLLGQIQETLECFRGDGRNNTILSKVEDMFDKMEALDRDLYHTESLQKTRSFFS